jgi:uncharacterized protein
MQDDRPLIASVNLTTACNLACTYCHAIHRREHLDDEGIDQTARGLGALREPAQIVPFGGEPLSAWRAFQRLVEGSESGGVREFLLCTNGLLVNPERIEYFAAHHVEVTVSWDGVAEANDRLRVYADGTGTSTEIERVFDLFRERYRRRLQLRITVGPDTAQHFAASVKHALDRLGERPGVKICFMPVSTLPWSDYQLAELDGALAESADAIVAARRAGRDVALAYNECIRAHELGRDILFQDQPHAHACLWGVKMIGVDTDGGIFPCHTVVELRKEQRAHLRMGHVSEGVPDLRRRLELMPPPDGNPWHCCWAWNLAGFGDPFRIPEVYRRVYRAFIRESVRVVEALQPADAARARLAAEKLVERTAGWEAQLAGASRPAPGGVA